MVEANLKVNEYDISVEDEALFHSAANVIERLPSTAENVLEALYDTSGRRASPTYQGVGFVPHNNSAEASGARNNPTRHQLPAKETSEEIADRLVEDGRSPLMRFRTAPKRPLSVTDLVSSQWCELQHYFTLTKLPFGKKVATAAMKGGSKVHKKLEQEVHVPVVVSITTKEDGFAVRLWNIIQGFRTLRDRGLTRELEVWGIVDGNVVSGIIDQVHTELPDGDSEAGNAPSQDEKIADQISHCQTQSDKDVPRLYITDVKTRAGKRKPSGSGLRPTKVQLYLYHRFLSDIADGKLDLLKVFERYEVDPDAYFSDSYVAQLSEMHGDVEKAVPPSSSSLTETSSSSPLQTPEDLVKCRKLRDFIVLFQEEVRQTFPLGSCIIDKLVTVEYRSRDGGGVVGTHCFEVEAAELQPLVDKSMEWWRWERRPDGVPVEEAFKCRICDFAISCPWRQKMDDEILARAREKVAASKKGAS